MDDQKQQVIDTLKQANNILVTVRNSPSIDQLAACIALTLVVNGLNKHGTAVFSGRVPSTLDFLEPGKTLETNTDSLRDFIISLDKTKADKLRYKVEDSVVKVFITPYRTSLSANDLEFSQGDFNVDVVVALGVHNQDDLDQAITAHGRILHDATVISLNTEGGAQDMGSINWVDSSASSLSELVFSFVGQLGSQDAIDNQIATALLTGIVSETDRFSNNKTKPQTMEAAAKLLAAGANQELVATKLAEPEKPEEPPKLESSPDDQPKDTPETSDDTKGGQLEIEHQPAENHAPVNLTPSDGLIEQLSAVDSQHGAEQSVDQAFKPEGDPGTIDLNEPIHSSEDQATLDFLKEHEIADNSRSRIEPLHTTADLMEAARIVPDEPKQEAREPGSGTDDIVSDRFALTPPVMGGTLTANLPDTQDVGSRPDDQKTGPILSHDTFPAAQEPSGGLLPVLTPGPESELQQEKPFDVPQFSTLEDLEKQVHAHQADATAAKDMPQPATIKLPTVQAAASPASPLGPPPPVPPPFPGA